MPKQSFPIRIGKVSLELIGNNLRLRWTYKGKRSSLNFGNFSPEALEAARSKAHEISGHLYKGTLELSSLQSAKTTEEQSLLDLWHKYLAMKLKSGLKEKTKEWYKNLDSLVHKLDDKLVFNGFVVKDALLEVTTIEQTRITLKALSSCSEYGIKRGLILSNSFRGVWEELPDQHPKQPYCFNNNEVAQILQNFHAHPQYHYYFNLILFWLYTGCRPSEALGITWGDVASDFDAVTFRGSPQEVKGQGIVWSEGSKNYKKGSRKPQTLSRTMPIGTTLSNVLEQHKPSGASKADLVFPARNGKYLIYTNFCQRAWTKCARSIKGLEKTTPYNFRDTFITQQLAQGVPAAIIAAWCDNSPSIIEARYADYLKLGSKRPIDF